MTSRHAREAVADWPGHLDADRRVCEALRATDCQGSAWELFAGRMYRKSVRTTGRLMLEGRMFVECGKRRRPIPSIDFTDWPSTDVKALAHEAVTDNFRLFREVGILRGDWDPRRGASLSTYFVNGVILCFPNALSRALTARRNWQGRVSLVEGPDVLDRIDEHNYSASLASCAEWLNHLLGAVTAPDQRTVAELYFVDGMGVGQIAGRLGRTEAATRSLLDRARTTMRNRHRSEQGGR